MIVQVQNCIFSDPRDAGGAVPSGKDNFQFRQMDCTATSTDISATSTPLAIPQHFQNSTTTLATSTDVAFLPFVTAGDIAVIAFLLLYTTILSMYAIGKGLGQITRGKKYLQYGGGDVEIRNDL